MKAHFHNEPSTSSTDKMLLPHYKSSYVHASIMLTSCSSS